MATKTVRDIIRIDEEKCDGCAACALSCAEGAIEIIDGKAKLVSEIYCDGLGACIGECPQGALTIEKRESDEFDEHAVETHLDSMKKKETLPCGCPGSSVQQFEKTVELPMVDPLPCGCPSTTVQQFGDGHQAKSSVQQDAALAHWPVQLTLVPPNAPFLQGADLLLASHCGPFAYGNFHQDFIKDHAVLCACPKLDDAQAHQEKLTELLRQSDIKSVTVVRMEVPCCGGLTHLAQQAIVDSGKSIPIKEVTIGVKGNIVA
ncbi:MAG: 4Fe-4S ferredoxin [Chloroflexi bacterium]|nr:4Fe-4S ferredoxin [Chloroflexota bacterium]